MGRRKDGREQEQLKVTGWAGCGRHRRFSWGKNSLAERNVWSRASSMGMVKWGRGASFPDGSCPCWVCLCSTHGAQSQCDWVIQIVGMRTPFAANSWRDLGKGIGFLWAALVLWFFMHHPLVVFFLSCKYHPTLNIDTKTYWRPIMYFLDVSALDKIYCGWDWDCVVL